MRTEPESWSGVSMYASTTSTRCFAWRSASSAGASPFARWVASATRPALRERRLVDRLVLLDAGRLVPTGRDALEVHDRRRGLVAHRASRGAHGEREVGVLVVRRRVARVEAAERREQRRGDREAGARAVVDVAHVVVLGPVGIVAAPEVPGRAVAPHDAAGFLQAAVRIDELRADEPRVGIAARIRVERVEPAGRDDRVVVEEHEALAARPRGAEVARRDEADVALGAHERHAGHRRKRLRQRLRRRVVDDDHLDVVVRDRRVQALEAGERRERLPVRGNDDR